MKKTGVRILFLSILIIGLSLVSTGCTNQTNEAKKLIKQAETHLDKAAKIKKKQEERDNENDASNFDAEPLDKIYESTKKQFKVIEKEINSAIALFEKAKKLNISDEHKKYLDLEITAEKANLKRMIDLQNVIETVMKSDSFKKLRETSLEDIENDPEAWSETLDKEAKQADIMEKEQEKLEKSYKDLKKKAKSYFKDNKLGS